MARWSWGTKSQFCKMSKFWRYNAGQCVCSYKYCIVLLKLAKKIGLKCFFQTKNSNYGRRYVNYIDCDNYFTVYIVILLFNLC